MANHGFIYVEPGPNDYWHGDGLLGDLPTNPTGDWTQWLPPDNLQARNGFEPNDCVTQATIGCVEILERQEFGDTTTWSRKFLAEMSGTGVKGGNDPQTVCETLRKLGCVTEEDYPFAAPDFNTFYQQIPAKLIELAKYEFRKYSYGHSWVMANPASMMNALTFSPISLGGYSWQFDTTTGYAITPKGSIPEHCFIVYGYVENDYWKIFDSYNQTHKKLAWDYTFSSIKRHTLHRIINTNYPGVGTVNWPVWINHVRGWLGWPQIFGGVARSPKWPAVRAVYLAKNPTCSVCGGTKQLEVHHKNPYHLHPELELEETNLITLCNYSLHHLWFGHLGNFQSFNKDIEVDAKVWDGKIRTRP